MTPLSLSAILIDICLRIAAFSIALAMVIGGSLPVYADKLTSEPRVLGYQQCTECHELQTEAWMRSSHASRSLAMLSDNSRAQRYARRLNISPADITRDSLCTNCHGTRQQTDTGILQVAHGVSCESCHGPSGESEQSIGWFRLHSGEVELASFVEEEGGAVIQATETGAVRDLYSLAVRCYECHTVADEQVVGAGHMTGSPDFELTTWFSGEVRHNFAPYTIDVEDEETNMLASNVWLAKAIGRDPAARKRLMYVVGQLADLEVSLRNRAKATQEGTFATAAAGRCVAADARLKQLANRAETTELEAATKAVESIRSILFLPPQASHVDALSEAADSVATAAREFVANYDGTQLAAIEALLPQETKGQAFQP